MALNRSPVRGDIPYLSRRVKPAAQAEYVAPVAQAAPVAPAPPIVETPPPAAAPRAPAGLSLAPSGAGDAASAPASVPAGSLPFPAPTIDEVRELGDDDPVLRLNARESAIGSLIVSGASTVVWEDVHRVTGSATASGGASGSPVTTPGNRPLLGFDDADAIVALRHLRMLRRALIVGRGPDILGVQIFDGSTVTVDAGDDERMYVLVLLRIAGAIELRAERVSRTVSDEELLEQFGFELTPHLVPRTARSR